MARTLKELNDYYKEEDKVNRVIRRDLKGDDEVVYGARALNAHFPPHLDKPTEDWDIYSPTPRAAAFEAEAKLDRAFGGDFFETEPAIHPRTWKIKSKITKRGVADFTKSRDPPYKTIGGIRYATLDHAKENIKKSLSDPESKFRHDKDREARQRIRIFESKYGKKRAPPRKKRRKNIFEGANLFDGWL